MSAMLHRFEELLRSDPTALESLMAAISFQLGLWIVLPHAGPVRAWLLLPRAVGMLMMAIGSGRVLALLIDNRMAREIAAFLSCATWVALAIFFHDFKDRPSDPVFYSFAIASAWVLLRLRVGF